MTERHDDKQHREDERAFLRAIVSKPHDAVTALELMRLHSIAIRADMLKAELGETWQRVEALEARSATEPRDALAQWKSRPSAEEIEAHYPGSQHQPDECEMCRFIHDAAKAYINAAPQVPERGPANNRTRPDPACAAPSSTAPRDQVQEVMAAIAKANPTDAWVVYTAAFRDLYGYNCALELSPSALQEMADRLQASRSATRQKFPEEIAQLRKRAAEMEAEADRFERESVYSAQGLSRDWLRLMAAQISAVARILEIGTTDGTANHD